MDDDVKSVFSADEIRNKADDYRRSAAAARRQARRAVLPEIRDAYFRTAEGFEKLAVALAGSFKRTQQ
jgi:hypothetical protein